MGVALGPEQKLQTWETPAPEAPSHPFHPSQSGQPKSKGRGKGPLEEGGAAENGELSLTLKVHLAHLSLPVTTRHTTLRTFPSQASNTLSRSCFLRDRAGI